MAIASVMGIDPTAVADTPEFQLGQLGAIITGQGRHRLISPRARVQIVREGALPSGKAPVQAPLPITEHLKATTPARAGKF